MFSVIKRSISSQPISTSHELIPTRMRFVWTFTISATRPIARFNVTWTAKAGPPVQGKSPFEFVSNNYSTVCTFSPQTVTDIVDAGKREVHTFYVRAVDEAGNAAAPVSFTWEIGNNNTKNNTFTLTSANKSNT